METLLEWRNTAVRALDDMRRDMLDDDKLLDGTLPRDFAFLFHLMGRWEQIVNQIELERGPHRGPGTPGYREI